MIGSTRVRAPWQLWVVGLVSLLWNAFGCTDFAMTVTRNPQWMAPLSPEMIDWLDAAPTWTVVTWALGVWGGLAGSLLLLLRSRWAVAAFTISLLGLAVNQLYPFLSDVPDMMKGAGSIALTATIWAVAVFLLWYAVRMRTRRVLA
ncbi:hypothetical protein ACLIMP_00810 [Novosphingobium aerophilum]|uniref:hypothetical protein n=1 Tax=Novosphingobium TaxID=165696 RepID=UPI0006C8D7A3|nr:MULTISPECIES: hypothetical protein [unclassified Novosphingobium]KPH60674.1 hypothetical protein ADT71_19635 [Novosphingobium sp. ST904]MPS67910.1 hypothetical protein [Novosphingobium sp.]TCM39302.1 hypothetical protein EDF59_106184 [Novosphingobium sp. ST904]WRT92855.1 hypothetical protein U9J33_16950 [Novosphingobium sp. RL4]